MKRLPVLCVLLLCALLLTACPTGLPAPKPLQLSDASFQSTDNDQLAIAVDASGAQHIARIECNTSTWKACRVIYEARRSGMQLAYHVYLPDSGYLYRNPDIAVTDSGLAFMTWQDCPDDDPNTRLCITDYIRSDELDTVRILEVNTRSLSAPVVVARGETVYVVNEVPNGAIAGALRYCRISDFILACHWVSLHPDPATDVWRRQDAAAAVSNAGALYVTWLEKSTEASSSALYDDNYGALDSDMGAHFLPLGSYQVHFPSAIAIETDDSAVYMLVSIDNTPGSGSDGMIVYYVNPANSTGEGGLKAVDLPAAKNWKIRDAPSLTAGSSWALAGFSAENTDHTGSEIYWFTYVAGVATAPVPTIPMSTALNDCDPVVALVASMQSVGWHICGFPPTRDDVYFFSFADGPEGVIHSPASDFAGRGGLDMAANGDYVAGVWNEVQSDGRIATWLAYNSYMIWLPAISR